VGAARVPGETDNPFLALIQLERPLVFQVLQLRDAVVHHAISHRIDGDVPSRHRRVAAPACPPGTRAAAVPQPENRSQPMLMLDETHFARTPGGSPAPTRLTIPQRGLYTGVMILGAVGSGKTSACSTPTSSSCCGGVPAMLRGSWAASSLR
jgi:hypothetical protein